MIPETHASLEAFLRTRVLGRSGVAVAFEVPGKAWAAARKEPTVNCFLYDVRENQQVKHAGNQPLRDESGRIVAHRPVPRYVDHCYLVSAWAPSVAVEHRLLSAVLAALLAHDALPRAVLQGALAQQPRHVPLSVVQGNKRGMLLSLAGEQRLALELELTVPWSAGPDEAVAGHVEQLPRITVTERPPGAQRVPRRVLVPAQPVGDFGAPAAGPHDRTAAPAPAPPGDATSPTPAVPTAPAPADGEPTPAVPTAPAPPDGVPVVDPQQAAARLVAQIATRVLAQLQAAQADPGPGGAPPGGPTPAAVARVGAQAGQRIATLVETPPGRPPAAPDAASTPLQQHAARLGATAAVQVLTALRAATEATAAPASDGTPPAAPTARDAAALGARTGAALAAAVRAAAGRQRPG